MVVLIVLCEVERLEDGGMSVVEACGLIAIISDLDMEWHSMGSGIPSTLWR